MTNRKIEYWVIPPEADAEFVAAHGRSAGNLRKAVRSGTARCSAWTSSRCNCSRKRGVPIPATSEHAEARRLRIRAGGHGEHLHVHASRWPAGARRRRARSEDEDSTGPSKWPRLLEGRYAACEQVILVCDNLNTHTKGAFYEAFAPERARALVRRIEFCHTPKHGSWLNIAENELSSLTRQCVSRPPLRRRRHAAASRNRRLVDRRQRHATRRRLANENRRRPLQTQVRLPENQAVTKH